MGTPKTLLSLRAENQDLFDASSKGTSIKQFGEVHNINGENELEFKNGGLQIGQIQDLENSTAFTMKADVTPENIIRTRQNIIESQRPAVTLFIDEHGYLNGGAYLQNGWELIKSSTPITAGIKQKIVFTRDASGNFRLEVDGNNVGEKRVEGNKLAFNWRGYCP